eukprot:scaffold107002_cov28-Prasinocladus_malaysianus.AAC.3
MGQLSGLAQNRCPSSLSSRSLNSRVTILISLSNLWVGLGVLTHACHKASMQTVIVPEVRSQPRKIIVSAILA